MMNKHAAPAPPARETLRAQAANELGVTPDRIPRHVAIIMDGNGRWALSRGLSRVEGHQAGAEAVRRTITECGRLGIEVLTLYSFSLENWKRPTEEVSALMRLAVHHLVGEREELQRNQVRVVHVGRRTPLPEDVLAELDATTDLTSQCTGLTVALALNYSSRAELTDAVRQIACEVARGKLSPEQIDENAISKRLYTASLPDPDLLIRTAGEFRLSNYLLWQLSYAELHITATLWPDFSESTLRSALLDYAGRNRRFGGLDASNT